MRKGMVRLLMVLVCTGLFTGGCAKKEMLKGEEEIAPAAKPAEAPPQVKAPEGRGGAEGEIKEQPVREPLQAVTEEPMKETAQPQVAAELDKVYFDYDSYSLSPVARETLSRTSDYLLRKNTSVKVQIEGHCDERGSDEYNMALGEKRAKSAYDYLTSLGVPAARMATISYGEEKPAELGQDEAAWAKNRRVEFRVIK